ncbi:ABC transporter [Pseudoclavibacter sp. RFBJ3]|uniref:ABC transporter permease n=1 Tax=unclassified Pseudoclavibacter TaxID=2615177 RepID=UPI000CE8E760|nr:MULTISPECIES: ABC transporter permease [unclassified Pseudoclavibacter]PPF34017.1 ABC transporter [Pseudoclavibacter sp. AY1H1]PPF76682.1 ABC transporter [Pseudoclavibacter sp. Z016]PPF85348.1 ABC transporter [Pseudoclavibacter sp. RFBJ5]PPF93257.1 ABC transporter [Pseudoclavibacter sp. RFBJ3]PPF98903.1 ABC transporter [Pseudoclavibacter sp. RFBH5]
MSAITAAFRDGSIVARRNVLNVQRTPGALVTGIAQPIIFVLILAFVFGGALGGADYRQFLIGGILAQTLTFNSSFTAVYLAKDLQSGLIDRLRTLPMSRVGVILGRTSSDLVTSIISIAVILTCGLAIGWRVESGPLEVLAAFALLLLFAFATSWIGATIALTAKSVEVAQSLGLLWLFPVCFISGAFVSADMLPGPLRAFAEWNPVTAVASAVRELFGNAAPSGFTAAGGWPAENAVLYAFLCSVAIIAIFAPIAVWQYRRISRR